MTASTKPTEKTAVVSVRTSERLRDAFESAAEKHGMTIADVMRGLIAEWVTNPRPVSSFMQKKSASET
jgi:antitoxin component of RelBE/YafQ-DinJ toxin-antitoxin module